MGYQLKKIERRAKEHVHMEQERAKLEKRIAAVRSEGHLVMGLPFAHVLHSMRSVHPRFLSATVKGKERREIRNYEKRVRRAQALP